MSKRLPAAVLATAFATLIAFMGIGVVDPLLPLIGRAMGATPFQVEWLFTSYIAVMALTMLISGVLATRLGGRKVMLLGLSLVVFFSTLSGLSPSIEFLAFVRAGWGLGNAFFTSTALSIIVGASTGGIASAITLYEAALGLGIASGPLIGGFLGNITWRLPFFGTATLMLIAVIFSYFLVREPKREAPRSAKDLFRAMRYPAILINALIGLAYSYAFFTILAYSPLTLQGLSSIDLGITYFIWGILVGISSVFVVNWLRPKLGPVRLLQYNLFGLIAIFIAAGLVRGSSLLVVIVLSGFFCGISNALFTTLAMEVSPYSRSISSGTYNFLRWSGAALAPIMSGLIGQQLGMQIPFFIAALLLVVGVIALFVARPILERALLENGEPEASHSHHLATTTQSI
ncbi:MFS transporter [Sulfoacidibacillus ferrooxidans]|uniref:Multidrug efflux protein YfmO n=1 Tax=Sulfoacidibacillus ferrooxidans TaxID=2005001 RepID=A0A9X2AC37_9BACL|nr:MFS transporter [Sulfoacidibacillus ferrooxidans]MCI0181840.1 Multidrug efflux protein YfmO [Sulfoacidibacillus ferrooxidans]